MSDRQSPPRNDENQVPGQPQQETPKFNYPLNQQPLSIELQQPKQLSDQYQSQICEEQPENQLKIYTKKINTLKQKQQLMKCSLVNHQEDVKKLFSQLYTKKKQLLDVVIEKYNETDMVTDIGIKQQLDELREIIKQQNNQIENLQTEMNMVIEINSDYDTIKLKETRKKIQNQIQIASKFASTQYVRDYLEKTHIYKVSYEDVRYEYQTKIRFKQQLELEKQLYDNKKQAINKAIQNEAKRCEELQVQRDRLLKILNQSNQK